MIHQRGGAEKSGEQQRPRAGENHAAAVARGVTRRRRRLHRRVMGGNLDAVGVNDNVLRRRGKAEQHRRQRHLRQSPWPRRVNQRHQANGGNDPALREQQPGAAPPQCACQKRQRQGVGQRRPDELEGISECRPTETGDGIARHARFVQPDGKAGKDEEERQPGGDAEQEKRDGAAVGVNGGGGEPAAKGGGHGQYGLKGTKRRAV